MSGHMMRIRATLTLKPTVSLPVVWAALDTFVHRFQICLADDASMPDRGEAPLTGYDDVMNLDANGTLRLSLGCRSTMGSEPDELDSLCRGLDGLVVAGGVVEIIDTDASADNDDAGYVRFVGATDAERIRARLAHGLALSKDWLVDVIGPDGFEKVRSLAAGLAEARLQRATAESSTKTAFESLPPNTCYNDMTREQQRTFDQHYGILPSTRERVAQQLAKIGYTR